MGRFRLPLALLFFLWIGFVLAALFVTQRPMALQVVPGLIYVSRSLLLVAVLLVNAAGLGGWILRRFFPFLEAEERLLLGTALGLGLFGLLGFGLAAAGATSPYVYLLIQSGLLIAATGLGWLRVLRQDAAALWQALRFTSDRRLAWIPWLAGAALGLSALLAFAPPADSFDALLYHLAIPEAWLRNGGLSVPTLIPVYWFPGLAEGTYVWGLALGSEIVPQFIHLAWGVLTVLLLWNWARKVWGNSVGWRAVALMLTMPSLPLLAAWAYTDLMLAFTSVAVLYLLWRSLESPGRRIWVLSGIFCGLAMGIKYTSFLLPVTAIVWLAWTRRRDVKELLRLGLLLGVPAILTACPWYLRNWIWVGNPFYPFLFGGKYWDSFLAAHYAQAGSGIGWKPLELLSLPLTVTLGYRDATFSDGRIGPVWLVLLPVCLWGLWQSRRADPRARLAIVLPALFGVLSLGAWTLGVINTSALWQSRLLFSALLALAPLAALAWDRLASLDTSLFRISFIFRIAVLLFTLVSLLDFGLFVLARNPLSAALGMMDRQAYFEQFQPSYGDALALADQTPAGAHIYFLFEPRSFGMDRPVVPDPINANLAHDFYLYHTPEGILRAWQSQGFTYVLYQRAGDALLDQPQETARLFSMLQVVAETPNTILYRIPSP